MAGYNPDLLHEALLPHHSHEILPISAEAERLAGVAVL
jgi:hypothetical protein